MVVLQKISKTELKPLVFRSYENDEELFNKYHVGKYDLNGCVEKTVEMIEDVSKVKELNYYKVLCDGEGIGYVVSFENWVYSFAIAMQYRNKEVLMEWWERVKEVMGSEFYATLYRNNVRASDFLKRQNMKLLIDNENEDYLVFSYN